MGKNLKLDGMKISYMNIAWGILILLYLIPLSIGSLIDTHPTTHLVPWIFKLGGLVVIHIAFIAYWPWMKRVL